VAVAGQLIESRVILGKRGKFAIATISDGAQTLDVFVYGDVYDRYRTSLQPDEVLFFKGRGRMDKMTKKMSLTADEVMTIDQWRSSQGITTEITVNNSFDIKQIERVLKKYATSGDVIGSSVTISLGLAGNGLRCDQVWLDFKVPPSDELRAEVGKLAGVQKVSFRHQ
jgi:DNA polymerase-3 subunit alpha